MLRGGCFKPRTSPYSFQGLGFEALEMLAEAGREYDLPIVTEVLSPQDVEPVARVADVLQIGARNMQNFSLLAEVGRVEPAGAAQARHDVHDGRVPQRRRVHPRPRQPPGHPVRARHPHLRDRDAQHARPRVDPAAEAG